MFGEFSSSNTDAVPRRCCASVADAVAYDCRSNGSFPRHATGLMRDDFVAHVGGLSIVMMSLNSPAYAGLCMVDTKASTDFQL